MFINGVVTYENFFAILHSSRVKFLCIYNKVAFSVIPTHYSFIPEIISGG